MSSPPPPPYMNLLHTAPAGVLGVFNITVAPAASFSVDMYMLMDLTLTMVQDVSSLKSFAGELGNPHATIPCDDGWIKNFKFQFIQL